LRISLVTYVYVYLCYAALYCKRHDFGNIQECYRTCASCGIVVEKEKQARCKNVYANASVRKTKGSKTPSLEKRNNREGPKRARMYKAKNMYKIIMTGPDRRDV